MIRAPIVTILGHVDHGKTSLLDFIRKSRLAAREHGGITQRIGAYEINTGIKGYDTDSITFIDTPGHEAFSQLRARGATVADIAVLVIDAKDSLMPQTVESISHIKNSKIPFIVALNKMDLPDARPDKVKRDLLKHEVVTESMGGSVIALPISAKTGDGIKELLEAILLIASDKQLNCDISNPVEAYIIETKKDQRGIVASVIIKDGTIKVGDTLFTDGKKIKVRSMISDTGVSLREVHPSTPFEILGFEIMPVVGARILSAIDKDAPLQMEEKHSDNPSASTSHLFSTETVTKKLPLVIKADSTGSLEAIVHTLGKNENIDMIMTALGGVHRSDIFLAKSAKAIVIGFGVAVDNEVKELAKQEKVIIKTYNIIYELLEELQEVSDLLKEKEEKEKSLKAEGKILATFTIDDQKVFGAKITKGKVTNGDTMELYRNNIQIGKSKLVSLKMRAKTVEEVKKDQECGLLFSPELDIRVGDVVKFIL